MKKVAVVGGGMSGLLSVLHYLRWTDVEIDWYVDEKEKLSIAQSTNPVIPKLLWMNANFGYEDLYNIGGTIKTGSLKENWGTEGSYFHDDYLPPLTAYHFEDELLRKYITNKISSNSRLNIYNEKVNVDKIDSDHIMVCSGKPENMKGYIESEFAPVNSMYVVRCFWDNPEFNYTLQIARKHGWVFGNPVKNRCDVGYVFNDKISTMAEVIEDMKEIFCEYGLTPSIETRVIPFKTYRRKNNFSKRIVYNGDASFFIEPMESNSLAFVSNINAYAFNLWSTDNFTLEQIDTEYSTFLDRLESFNMLYYYAGSVFDTSFWEMAKEKADKCMDKAIKDPLFVQYIYEANRFVSHGDLVSVTKSTASREYGYMWHGAFYNAIKHLKVYPDLIDKLNNA